MASRQLAVNPSPDWNGADRDSVIIGLLAQIRLLSDAGTLDQEKVRHLTELARSVIIQSPRYLQEHRVELLAEVPQDLPYYQKLNKEMTG